MSNFARAIKALEEADEFHGAMVDNEVYVRALQAAGLLMPDLPDPDVMKLNGDVKYLVCYGVQVRQDTESDDVKVYSKHLLAPTEARRFALALLAACEYAEKEQGNE